MKPRFKTIKVSYLARVEGEGSIQIKIKDDQVKDVKLHIFEPPRYFEAFLRGRKYSEAPDITARICGICPIAHQLCTIHALENAFDVKVHPQIRALRRLIYCGEWIESHALHIYMLHAPDFLGFQDAIQIAKVHPDLVKQGLALKKLGNDIMSLIGGREIHPISMKVGGFYKIPSKIDLKPLRERLDWGLEAALKTLRWVATLNIPKFEREYEFVCLRHPDEYAITEGRIVSNKGLDIPIDDFEKHFEEEHVEHSTSLHAIHTGYGVYHVGPLARYSINFDKLSPLCQSEARKAGLGETCNNPFQSIIVRSVELVYAIEECIRIIDQYNPPEQPDVPVTVKRGTGCGATEAPRGTDYHRYRVDDNGIITSARIMPPTSQNQKCIEDDLRYLVPGHLEKSQEDLTWLCEQAVRNYDPCISCSCHFLKLNVVRE